MSPIESQEDLFALPPNKFKFEVDANKHIIAKKGSLLAGYYRKLLFHHVGVVSPSAVSTAQSKLLSIFNQVFGNDPYRFYIFKQYETRAYRINSIIFLNAVTTLEDDEKDVFFQAVKYISRTPFARRLIFVPEVLLPTLQSNSWDQVVKSILIQLEDTDTSWDTVLFASTRCNVKDHLYLEDPDAYREDVESWWLHHV